MRFGRGGTELNERWKGLVAHTKATIEKVGEKSEAKPHVFVAMPYKDQMEDVFYFGIKASVHAIHYLCARIDQESFTGDILERLKTRIETASLVIADLTGDNPNVFLEVGDAWGKGRPTLLLAKEGPQLLFDVQGIDVLGQQHSQPRRESDEDVAFPEIERFNIECVNSFQQ